MPTKAQPAPDLFVPSSAHVALAIALIRAKPPGTSARGECYHTSTVTAADRLEYVLQLRDQVKPGSPGSKHDEHGHYLDLVAYWKEQCRRLQGECEDLRSENIKLERSNQNLTSLTSYTPDSVPANAMNTSKRKARALSPTRNMKRPKLAQRVEHSVAETLDSIDDDLDFLDGLGQGKSPFLETSRCADKLR